MPAAFQNLKEGSERGASFLSVRTKMHEREGWEAVYANLRERESGQANIMYSFLKLYVWLVDRRLTRVALKSILTISGELFVMIIGM